jgi:hypothetical protein
VDRERGRIEGPLSPVVLVCVVSVDSGEAAVGQIATSPPDLVALWSPPLRDRREDIPA